jgi:phosphatidylserine/phosphatidylglycerophosphate/cardiolipin synthase-like enzyme
VLRKDQIKLHKRGILSQFAEGVYANRQRIYRLWVVSPWVEFERARTDPVNLIIEALRGKNCEFFLFTRRPDHGWHKRAIELLQRNTRVLTYQYADLHTKLYILECNGFRSAILGSPNLTRRAERVNEELAIEVRTTVQSPDDPVSKLITEMTDYASGLRAFGELQKPN